MNTSGFRLGWGAMIGFAVACGLCGAAPAQEPTNSRDGPNAMTGTWEFSNADHDKICRFTFRAEAVAGGYRLEVDRNCANLFPSTKDVIGWALDTFGSLRLLDARGNAIIELTEAEDGIFDGFQPGEGRYVLQSAARSAGPYRRRHGWRLGDGAGNRQADLYSDIGKQPHCCKQSRRRHQSRWIGKFVAQDQARLRRVCDPLRSGRLADRSRGPGFAVGRGQTWRFEEDEPNTWLRVPEVTDHVTLVRQ